MTERLNDIQRVFLARRLFCEWTGVTNMELAGAMWNSLSVEDRQVWLQRIDEGIRPETV